MSKSFHGNRINPQHFGRGQIKFYLLLIPLALFMVLPIVFLINNAFKPVEELLAYPPTFLVKRPTLMNFKRMLSIASGLSLQPSRYLFNTFLLTSLVLLFSLLLSVAAGYALSKRQFKIKRLIFEINTLALMFVPVAVGVPRFLIMVRLGLYDTFWANVVPLIVLPVGLFLIKQFVDGIPDSLMEAARIDGASDWTILRRIVIPLARPALATIAILSFQAAWGSVEASQLYINKEAYKSFAYYISSFVTTGDGPVAAGVSAASALVLFLPNLLIFILMQSRVMNTMAYSGIK